jgi:hypothetical protein
MVQLHFIRRLFGLHELSRHLCIVHASRMPLPLAVLVADSVCAPAPTPVDQDQSHSRPALPLLQEPIRLHQAA